MPWALSPDGATLLCLGAPAFDFQRRRASIVDVATGELRADDVLPWIKPRRISLDPTGEWAWIEGARGDLGTEREAALVRYPFTVSPRLDASTLRGAVDVLRWPGQRLGCPPTGARRNSGATFET